MDLDHDIQRNRSNVGDSLEKYIEQAYQGLPITITYIKNFEIDMNNVFIFLSLCFEM